MRQDHLGYVCISIRIVIGPVCKLRRYKGCRRSTLLCQQLELCFNFFLDFHVAFQFKNCKGSLQVLPSLDRRVLYYVKRSDNFVSLSQVQGHITIERHFKLLLVLVHHKLTSTCLSSSSASAYLLSLRNNKEMFRLTLHVRLSMAE